MTEHTEERPDSAPNSAESEAKTPQPETPPETDPATTEPDVAVVEMQESEAASTAEAVETTTSEIPSDEEAERDPEIEAALQEATPPAVQLKKGQRVKGKLVRVGETDSFVDFGGRSEGVIATSELRVKPQKKTHEDKEHEADSEAPAAKAPAADAPAEAPEGEKAPASSPAGGEAAEAKEGKPEAPLLFKEGDELHLVVKSTDEPVTFTLGRKPMSPSMKKLKEAFEAKIPVQGTVKKTNKGGFEVSLPGARAFCPFSQVDLAYCDDPNVFLGHKYPFEIITFERNGRNIVVSRRRLLEEEAKHAAVDTRERLAVGEIFDGQVRRLQPYGAFIDIGGVDGLVHVSQIQHGHLSDPKDVLKVGQKVRVKVLKLEGLGSDRERISLSMKDLEPDPWSDIESSLPVGSTVVGKVVRLTEFGAFVELKPGVDGLVHISQISEDRIEHPGDVLAVGQEVNARVLAIEMDSQRISLSLREKSEAPHKSSRPHRPSDRHRATEDELHYRSETQPKESKVDVSNMEYTDALELLKRKFNRNG